MRERCAASTQKQTDAKLNKKIEAGNELNRQFEIEVHRVGEWDDAG